MLRHIEKTAKEHYYDSYNHRNNQCHYNRLILRKLFKTTKKKVMK